MGIGVSIFLIVLGAILTFALDFSVAGVDIDVVGWILMVGGLIGLLFTAVIWGPRNRSTVVREDVPPSEPMAPTTRTRRIEERTDI